MAFEKTKEFKTLLRDCYMIEAKNAELKNNLAYDTTLSYSINCMYIQGVITLFASNVLRILRLIEK